MVKSKQAKGGEELKPEGAPEPEPKSESESEQQSEPEQQMEQSQPQIQPTQFIPNKPQSRATGAAQGQGVTHFQRLASSTTEELQFKTEEELAKYNQDVRTINNMQLKDPVRFQAEYGYWPRRGDTTIEKNGLTPEQQDGVILGKYRLEGPDDKGNFKAVSIK